MPKISIMIVSMRPSYFEQICAQMNAQTYPNIEIIYICHGQQMEFEQRYKNIFDSSRLVIRYVDRDVSFGDALNLALSLSSGDYVTKVDDDDWYYPDHVYDLFFAHRYSGADLIGKSGEFVYLSDKDLTVQRSVEFDNGFVHNYVAGGTLFMSKDTFVDLGGWHTATKEVDRHLLEDVNKLGLKIYRCSALGYILNRHGTDHTWEITDDFFINGCQQSKPGLDKKLAGF